MPPTTRSRSKRSNTQAAVSADHPANRTKRAKTKAGDAVAEQLALSVVLDMPAGVLLQVFTQCPMTALPFISATCNSWHAFTAPGVGEEFNILWQAQTNLRPIVSGESLSAALSRRCLHDTDAVFRLCQLKAGISPWATACILTRDLGNIDLELLESIREILDCTSPDSSLSTEAEQYMMSTIFGIICELGRMLAIVTSDPMSLMTVVPPIGIEGDSTGHTQTRSEFILAGCITEQMVMALLQLLLPGELGKHAIGEAHKAVMQYGACAHTVKQPEKRRRDARAWEADMVPNSRQQDLCALRLSVGAVHRHLLLQRGVRCVGSNKALIEKGVDFRCTKMVTSAVEYLVAEILELSSNCARDAHKHVIDVQHIGAAVSADEELKELLERCQPIESLHTPVYSEICHPTSCQWSNELQRYFREDVMHRIADLTSSMGQSSPSAATLALLLASCIDGNGGGAGTMDYGGIIDAYMSGSPHSPSAALTNPQTIHFDRALNELCRVAVMMASLQHHEELAFAHVLTALKLQGRSCSQFIEHLPKSCHELTKAEAFLDCCILEQFMSWPRWVPRKEPVDDTFRPTFHSLVIAAATGQSDAVEACLKKKQWQKTEEGQAAIRRSVQLAAQRGHACVLQKLAAISYPMFTHHKQYGYEYEPRQGDTVSLKKSGQQATVARIMKSGTLQLKDSFGKKITSGKTNGIQPCKPYDVSVHCDQLDSFDTPEPLLLAVASGNRACVELMLDVMPCKEAVDPTSGLPCSWTFAALLNAASVGHLDIVELLIRNMEDNGWPDTQWQVLSAGTYCAVLQRHSSVATFLMSKMNRKVIASWAGRDRLVHIAKEFHMPELASAIAQL